ncbi:MAG: alpha/beta hydrolase [Elusimicrobia bacterium]|nr:alpha/beta hydrolase [Elusimicrobiota bacterium]
MTTWTEANRPVNKKTPADFGLPFETVTFPGVRELPLEAWVVKGKGLGPVLVFHGYHDAKSSMLPTAKGLNALGFDVLLVDFNGSGGSAGSETTIGWWEAEAVGCAARWAAARWRGRAPILYGTSMGAAAVLKAVGVDKIPASKLVVEAPFDRMLTAIERRLARRHLPGFPLAPMLLFWGSWQRDFDGFGHNPVEYAARVQAPTLLLYGDQDENIRPAETEAIFRNLAGPKTLHVFKGLAHRHLADERPDEWREAVKAFMLN